MDFNIITWLVFPLSIFLFLYNSKYLLYLTVFFIPFSGTAIIELDSTLYNTSGIPVSLFLTLVYILKSTLNYVLKQKIYVYNKSSIVLVILFMIVASSSLIMPIIINGKEIILDRYSATVMYATETELKFRFQYVTQLIYLLVGCLYTIVLVTNIRNITLFKSVISVYIISSIIVAILGIWQWNDFYINLGYPKSIFNHLGFKGSEQILYGIPRLYSVALEPSVLAMHLLTVVPFLFWAFYFKVGLFNTSQTKIFLLLTIFVLGLSLSASAFIGLGILFVFYILRVFSRFGIRKNLLLITIILVISGIILSPYIMLELVDKLESFSGIERITTISLGWEYFLKYPILGIGWGVFPAYDLLITMASGAGLLGIFSFSLLIYYTYFRLYKLGSNDPIIEYFRISIIQSFSISLLISQIAGFNYYNQIFWLILGISITFANIFSESAKLHKLKMDY